MKQYLSRVKRYTNQECGFQYIKFESVIRYSSKDIESKFGYKWLNFKGQTGAGNINL